MAKVLLAIPTGKGFIWADASDALYGLNRGQNDVVQATKSFYTVDEARNALVRFALKNDFDYVFFVDDDTIVPPDALLNLMENNVDVCLGYYIKSDSDNLTPMVEPRGNNYRTYYSVEEIEEMRKDGQTLVEIGGGGFGCALIKVSALKILTDPWFKFNKNLSEDYYFCHQWKSIRGKIYLDTRVACDHIKLERKKAM